MKINIYTNSGEIPEYQAYLLRALRRENPNVLFTLIPKNKSKRASIKVNFIEKRFSNYRINALATSNCEFLKELNKEPLVELDDAEYHIYLYNEKNPQCASYTFMFNSNINEIKENVGSLLSISIRRWENGAEIDPAVLEMDIENGFSNNLNKSYFYAMVLILKLIRCSESKIPFSTNGKIKRKKEGNIQLIRKIFLRQLPSKILNWKIAISQNGDIHTLKGQEKCFWADPFWITHENREFIFFEEIAEERKGKISVLESSDGFTTYEKNEVLTEDFHLSFPNIEKIKGEYYLIPEMSESNEQVVYRCTEFPLKWEKCAVLIPGIRLVDPVVFLYKHKYYLFANVIHEFEHDNNEALYIFVADHLLSEQWKPHALNPVRLGYYGTRNAGKIYNENGIFLRPSQNCLENYGHGIIINKIVKLNSTEFEEVEVDYHSPPKDFSGMHTFNKFGNRILTDVLRRE